MGHRVEQTKLTIVTTVPLTLWTFFRGQIGFLAERGFEVRGITSPGPLLERAVRQHGITVDAVPMSRRIQPLADLVSVWRITRRLRRTRPQIVHAHTPKAGLLGMLAALLARTPLRVYTLHGLRFETCTGFRRALLVAAERLTCRLARRVFVVSPSVRQVALRERLCAEHKLVVLANGTINGVDAATFDPARFDEARRRETRRELELPEDAIVVGFVGRIVRDKGVEQLVSAFDELLGRRAELHGLFVGPEESEDPISEVTRRTLSEHPRLHTIGARLELAPLYRAMDLLVLPTYREGFPVVPLEAAAMGLPVVATTTTGCVDAVIDGVTGTLVPPGEVDALSRAIENYVADPALRERHGRAGRERVLRDFRPAELWHALVREYTTLLADAGIGSAPEPR